MAWIQNALAEIADAVALAVRSQSGYNSSRRTPKKGEWVRVISFFLLPPSSVSRMGMGMGSEG
jgi:hypothetical protein